MSKASWCITAIVGYFGYMWYSTGISGQGSSSGTPFAASTGVVEGESWNFEKEVMGSSLPVLVYYYADW
jgi:thioredoxin-like negative regulator of GroEL